MRPILFQLGPIAVPAYGTFVLLALALGMLLIPRYARRAGLDPSQLRAAFFIIFLWGALGCRLLGVVVRFPEVIREPSLGLWLMRQAGVWYGAILGGLIAGIFVVRRYRLDFWRGFDVAAVPAVLGGGVGRVGCFLSGCCHGTPSDLPWAITYDNEMAHRLHADLPYESLHPTVLYETGAVLLIALILDRFGARHPRAGQVGLLWLVLYGAARFVIEFFRGDTIRGALAGLSTSQLMSVVGAVAALVVMVYRSRRSPAVPALQARGQSR